MDNKPLLCFVVGARPNFVKAAPVVKAALASGAFRTLTVHTGQHYDEALSDLFDLEAGSSAPSPEPAARRVPIAPSGIDLRSAAEMAAEAEAHYQRVRTSLQQWDWAEAGEGMKALEKTIGALRKTLEEEK